MKRSFDLFAVTNVKDPNKNLPELWVDIMINDKKVLVLFDSGAVKSSIRKDLCDSLGFMIEEDTADWNIMGITGIVQKVKKLKAEVKYEPLKTYEE